MSANDELDPVFAAARCRQVDAAAAGIERAVRARLFAGAQQRVGRYETRGVLGRGGLGTVLRGYDRALDREVAIKFVHVDDGSDRVSARARLLREARSLAGVVHPNVLEIFDVGEHGDDVYLVSELIEGETLCEWLRRRPPQGAIVDVFVAAGRGLAAAHAAGLVHRDFKPTNVVVASDGRVKVIDFGLAKLVLDSTADERGPSSYGGIDDVVTARGCTVGTPRYMAPEQMDGADVDARADVYAFSVTMYEALYGRHPFDAVVPRERRAGLRARVSRVLARGLRADPQQRWPSMDALVEALTFANRPRVARRRELIAVAFAAAVIAFVSLARGERRSDDAPLQSPGDVTRPVPVDRSHDDARVHEELVRVRARLDAGLVEPALADARATAELADAFASPALRVEAGLLVARCMFALGDADAAVARAEQAYWLAIAATDDASAVMAAADVMWLQANAGDGRAADIWREHASSALRRAPQAVDAELRFTALTAQVLERRGHLDEATALAERRAELAATLHGDSHVETLRARAALGFLLGRAGDRRGITECEAALGELERSLGRSHPAAIDARVDLGGALQALGEHARAAEVLQLALVHADLGATQQRRVQRNVIGAINNLALASFAEGRDRAADALFARAQAVLERSGAPERTLALVLTNRARVQMSLARLDDAEAGLRRAMDIAIARGEADTAAYATTLETAGMLALQREDPERAQTHFDAALAIRDALGDPGPWLRARVFAARAAADRGHVDDARARVEATLVDALARGLAPLADAYVILGDVARVHGDRGAAIEAYRAAVRAWQHEPADRAVIEEVEALLAALESDFARPS